MVNELPIADFRLPNEGQGAPSFQLNRKSAISNRQSGFWLLIALLALFAAAKPVLFDTMDPDCFWHLKVAEQLRQQGIGPIVDTLSYNSIKTPWTPYSWLAELGMKALWDVGGFRAAVATQSILQGLFVALLALCGRTLRRNNPLGVVLAVTICLFFSMPYLSFRPVTLAIDLLAVISWLTLRDAAVTRASSPRTIAPGAGEKPASRNAIWLVVPLTALLTNVHFFSVLVPLIFAARVVGNWVERENVRRDVLLLIATTLACCMTPMLPGMLEAVWHYQFTDAAVSHRLAAEFSPIYAGSFGWVAAVLLLAWVVAMLRSSLRMSEKLWAAGFAILLLRMGRFAPVFAPIGVATIAFALPQLKSVVLERASLRLAMSVVLLIGIARVALAFPSSTMSLPTWLNRNGPDTPGYPTAAAEFVEAHVRSGQLLNEFSWGGYLEWRLGEAHPAFIDGRTQLFPPALWQQIADGTTILPAANATAAILPLGRGPMHQSLITAGWSVAFEDERAEVLVPPMVTRAE